MLRRPLPVSHLHQNLIVTAFGEARSAKAFTNWIKGAATKAGLSAHRSPHGLRKAACRSLAEAGAGASVYEIMAITGHQNASEVQAYVDAANKKKLVLSGNERHCETERERMRTESQRKIGQPCYPVSQSRLQAFEFAGEK